MQTTYLSNVTTLQLDADKCTGCNMCVIVCPHNVFELQHKKSVIIHKDQCMECGACALNCKDEAIQVQSGVGCATGILNGLLNNSEPTCGCGDGSVNCC